MMDLFDKLVTPVLTYGSEVWGFSSLKGIESFHRKCLKSALNISKYTANAICYGETGREPLVNTIYKRMINFWLNLKQGNPNKISSVIFRLGQVMFDRNLCKVVLLYKLCY